MARSGFGDKAFALSFASSFRKRRASASEATRLTDDATAVEKDKDNEDDNDNDFDMLNTPPPLPQPSASHAFQHRQSSLQYDVKRAYLVTDIGDHGTTSYRYKSLRHMDSMGKASISEPERASNSTAPLSAFQALLRRREREMGSVRQRESIAAIEKQKHVHPMDIVDKGTERPIARYLQEHQRYTFALVLRNTFQVADHLKAKYPYRTMQNHDLQAQVLAMHEKICRRLVQAGLGIILLDNDSMISSSERGFNPLMRQYAHTNQIVILVDPYKDKDLLAQEFKREKDEWAIKKGSATARLSENSYMAPNLSFSPALELQLTQNIIFNALKDYDTETWVQDMQNHLGHWDVIEHCFPLHDRKFNEEFFEEYRKRTFDFSMAKATTGNRERWAIEELRFHFGERVAFLFAFMHIYSKFLLPLTVICVLYYIIFRTMNGYVWAQYSQGLTVISFLASSVWAPLFLVFWQRETALLVEKWNIGSDKETAFEVNDENPLFQYKWSRNPITNKMEKVAVSRNKTCVQFVMLGFIGMSILFQSILTLPFIQWYVYAKTVKTCNDCKTTPGATCLKMVTCFDSSDSAFLTDRWWYILVQGAVLGLLIDVVFFEIFNWVSAKFVSWENYASKSEFENRLVHRRFLFVWMNWFFWFLFLAFVYLPFGEVMVTFLQTSPQVPAFIQSIFQAVQWDPAVLTLDTLFVTPLVITQFINMLMETILPYLIRSCKGKPMHFRNACLASIMRFSKAVYERCKIDTRVNSNTSARALSEHITQSTRFFVPLLLFSDDSNGYTAYNVIADAKLTPFDTTFDYLDASIQFSYVVMFTVVWPLLPFPAFFNNLLEVRGDAFRLLFVNRRPMPRRDVSIGEWATVLSYANIIGITVVAGLIAVYHFSAFVGGCNFEFATAAMVPISALNASQAADTGRCNTEIGSVWIMPQIVVFVLLEHAAFFIRYLILQVNKNPSSIQTTRRLKHMEAISHVRSAHNEQFDCLRQLRIMFDKYDPNGDDYIESPDVLQSFVSEWTGKPATEMMAPEILFHYMDKTQIGRVSFASASLLLLHVHHDRFLSRVLGISDWLEDFQNAQIQATEEVQAGLFYVDSNRELAKIQRYDHSIV
ncbi:hypothetical protein Ae201684P_001907 [Aphanomyces euteiches]|uniref:Anoctamin transmembrane domain-containing protein n=1 Tax=Aphanomyces euteiches TaxID=100861 RepID=A0A6G0XJZ8_9STRA|nr:hypothetical protein Ae201684_003986 [Aphanomyces euteiches]KAH9084667.1 hypothetical protein Ae201684P_001907 [Aphanomyces euteiches]KAH9138648.1 hypothetical protein AeRB84_017057 [Aphanomyces euteiches]